MPITRGQMKRQLYEGGGIMDVVPREPAILGGLKKAAKKTVKKVTGGIKDILSSDLILVKLHCYMAQLRD